MKPITVEEAQDKLKENPNQIFYLQQIRVPFIDVPGSILAGYHIYTEQPGQLLPVKGKEIWDWVYI